MYPVHSDCLMWISTKDVNKWSKTKEERNEKRKHNVIFFEDAQRNETVFPTVDFRRFVNHEMLFSLGRGEGKGEGQ